MVLKPDAQPLKLLGSGVFSTRFVFNTVCFLHRHLDACCTSCVSSHFHLGRVKLPYVTEPLSFQITPNSPSSCTV